MRKFFLFALLAAATAVMAETKVENFTPKDNTGTATYVTSVTTKECQQASWTFFSGGIRNDVGNFGSFAAVIRAKKNAEAVYPYFESSKIDGGIDSLWFQWNSNGDESSFGNWRILIYINDVLVDSITEKAGKKIAAGGPFNVFKKGGLNVTGEFTIKLVNMSPYDGTGNALRFVFDDLSWEPKAAPGEKTKPEFEFAETAYTKWLEEDAFKNTLTNTSDATPTFESSDKNVATVAADGTVTIVGVGNTTITAAVAETETYKAAEASYTVRVVPMNCHIETFDSAHNIDMSGTGTYLTTATESFKPSLATGLKWTSLLGSVRNNLGGGSMPPVSNIAAVIRAKKTAEANYGYLLSSTITGGIDSLAFDWSCNGTEASRQKPWNIKIYINDVEVGAITDACTAVPAKPYRFSVGNLKVDGDFTIKIVNLNVPDDGTSNHYRWVVDNIEWYSYEKPCEPSYGIMVDGENYVAGVKNEAQTSFLEYTITATLKADQTFVIYDACAKVGFMARQDNYETNYKFNYTEGNAAFLVPQDGKYTIYLKMYGIDNNEIYTAREDIPTGIENAALKADVRKAIENGVVVIYRNGVRYNLQGQNF
ncbi:MAG: hypothetical protein IJQ32_05140 [Paludibacteraceae bacterium]|nr:hypothetical protein [Paludibacteraceae bacterium]